MTGVRRFLALSQRERRLFVRAVILLPLVRSSLVVLGCRRTQAWLDLLSHALPSRSVLPDRFSYVAAVERMVAAAARSGIVTASCLPRGLVVCAILRSEGVDATLKLGVRRHFGRFEAHAWVETHHARSDTARTGGFVPLETPLA